MYSSQKTQSEQFDNPPLSLQTKSLTQQLIIWTNFNKINENLVKNAEKVSKNSWITSNIHKILNLNNSQYKPKIEKIFPYSTLDGLFDDTTHNSLQWLYRSVKIVWTKKSNLII